MKHIYWILASHLRNDIIRLHAELLKQMSLCTGSFVNVYGEWDGMIGLAPEFFAIVIHCKK